MQIIQFVYNAAVIVTRWFTITYLISFNSFVSIPGLKLLHLYIYEYKCKTFTLYIQGRFLPSSTFLFIELLNFLNTRQNQCIKVAKKNSSS